MTYQEHYRIISRSDLHRIFKPFVIDGRSVGEGGKISISPLNGREHVRISRSSESELVVTSCGSDSADSVWYATVDCRGYWSFREAEGDRRWLIAAGFELKIKAFKSLAEAQEDPLSLWLLYRDFTGFRLRSCSGIGGWLGMAMDRPIIFNRAATVDVNFYWHLSPCKAG